MAMKETGSIRVLLTEEQIQERIRQLGKQITRDYEGKTLLMVGILKGSCMFLCDLAKRVELDVRMDFMSVSSYGSQMTTSGKVQIKKDLENNIKGKDVLIIEDIIDSGMTMSKLLPLLREREPASLRVCTFLDKPSRRQVPLQADYTGFAVEDAFIVGYGLDYDEKYRQLPYVACLEG